MGIRARRRRQPQVGRGGQSCRRWPHQTQKWALRGNGRPQIVQVTGSVRGGGGPFGAGTSVAAGSRGGGGGGGGGFAAAWNAAETWSSPLSVTLQVGLVPAEAHAAPQPANRDPGAGVAVSVITVPSGKAFAQFGSQLIPAGSLRTDPFPVFVTVSVCVVRAKCAPTLASPE